MATSQGNRQQLLLDGSTPRRGIPTISLRVLLGTGSRKKHGPRKGTGTFHTPSFGDEEFDIQSMNSHLQQSQQQQPQQQQQQQQQQHHQQHPQQQYQMHNSSQQQSGHM
uniref:Uncharacterized protein n=1 Tax=Anopheles culicifacies TaxID=139723 RepID=A0A182MB87_9DIPT